VTAAAPDRLESLRGLCFCLLYDLCCWLAGADQPVPDDAAEYALGRLREVPDPRGRLAAYVGARLLSSWERVLQPFFLLGAALEPELGEAGPLRHTGLERGGRVRAELRFRSRSRVRDRRGRAHDLAPRDWVLTVWLAPDLDRVESAALTPA
jgi:hypothetical protein